MEDGQSVHLNVGCFNAGIFQDMLLEEKHKHNIRRILRKIFEECGLHLLGLCEVGGHKAGLGALGIHPQDLLEGALPVKEFRAAANQAYMSVCHETGTGVSLKLREVPTYVPLTSRALDPQLVILDVSVTGTVAHQVARGETISYSGDKKTHYERSTQSAGGEG